VITTILAVLKIIITILGILEAGASVTHEVITTAHEAAKDLHGNLAAPAPPRRLPCMHNYTPNLTPGGITIVARCTDPGGCKSDNPVTPHTTFSKGFICDTPDCAICGPVRSVEHQGSIPVDVTMQAINQEVDSPDFKRIEEGT
jgi:hypothetical protein